MEILPEIQSDLLVLRVQARRIDAAGAIGFKDMVRKACDGHAGQVVLDLSQVDFVDSSGLGAIVACYKLIGKSGRLDVAALTPTVSKLFELTRMNSVFVVHQSVDAALAAA